MELDILAVGQEYISASRASQKTGYTSDYIGQLCRSGKVPAKLIGRTWYVDLPDLLSHRETHQAGRRKQGARLPVSGGALAISKVPFIYEADDRPLLPVIAKRFDAPMASVVAPKRLSTMALSLGATALTFALVAMIGGGSLILREVAPPETEAAAVSFFDALVGAGRVITDGFAGLRDLAFDLPAQEQHLPAPTLALAPTPVAITQPAPAPLPAIPDLRAELEAYVRSQVAARAIPNQSVVIAPFPAPDPIILRQEIFQSDTQPAIVRQSDANAAAAGLAVSSLQNAGTFFSPTLESATFDNATGTTLSLGTLTVANCVGCAGSTFAFPFATQGNGDEATSTTFDFFGGLLSMGSSTIDSLIVTSSLADGALGGFGTRCLQTNNSGLISVAASACGSGGAGGSGNSSWSTTTSQVAGEFVNYPNNNTDIVTVGNFSTTTAPVYFDPNVSAAKIFNQYFGLSSTTLQNVTAKNSTTTNATSTTLAATTFCLSGDCRTAFPAALTFAYPFLKLSSGENATSTTLEFNNGFVSTASSTLTTFTATSATTTSATSTDLYVSNLASTTQLRANTSFIGFLTSGSHTAVNFLATGSSTLQSFFATNGTTTSATSTNLAATTFCLSGDCRTAFPSFSMSFAYPFVKLATGENATSTTLEFNNGFVSTASSTLTTFTATNATTTSATSTNLATTSFCLGSDCRTSFPAALTFSFPFTKLSTGEQATSTTLEFNNGFVSTASSTLSDFLATNGTTTNATSTNLSVSSSLSLGSLAGFGIRCLQTNNNGFISVAASGCGSGSGSSSGGSWATTTSQVAGEFINYSNNNTDIVTVGNSSTTTAPVYFDPNVSAAKVFNQYFGSSSTTLQNFFATNGTTTSATSTNLAATTFCLSGDCRTSFPAALTFAWPWTKLSSGEQATSTILAFQNGFLAPASSTLATFTFTNATGTAATTTGLAITGVTSKILYAFPDGDVGPLTVGTGLSLTNGTLTNSAQSTFTFPFTKQANGDQATSTLLDLFGGFFSNASSTVNSSLLVAGSTTLQNFTGINATTTSATSTDFYVSGLASTTNLRANVANIGIATFGIATATNMFAIGGVFSAIVANVVSSSQVLGTAGVFGNILATGSSTFQNTYLMNATSTNLYATNFLASASTTLQKTFISYASTTEVQSSSDAYFATSGGKVGIGTTTPFSKLQVNPVAGDAFQFFVGSSSASNAFISLVVDKSSRTGVGTSSPMAKLQISDTGTAQLGLSDSGTLTASHWNFKNLNGGLYIATSSPTSFATSTVPAIYIERNSGTIGIHNSDPTLSYAMDLTGNLKVSNNLDFGGTITGTSNTGQISAHIITADGSGTGSGVFVNVGAVLNVNSLANCGTLAVDGSGNFFCTSDERLKNIDRTYATGLSAIEAINPIVYTLKPEFGFATNTAPILGFSAQNVMSVIPEAVTTRADGYYQLNTSGILAAAVNALKEIGHVSGAFKDSLVAWLGDAGNGIQKLFAREVHTDTLCVKKSDGTELCLTGDQLATIVSASGGSVPTTIEIIPPTEATSTPEQALEAAGEGQIGGESASSTSTDSTIPQ